MVVLNQPKGRVGRIDEGNPVWHTPGERRSSGRQYNIGRHGADFACCVRSILCNDRPRMEWGEAPCAKRTAQSGICLVKRQDRCAQGTDMDNLVTFVCKRFRHMKWGAGPKPDVACVANRGECDPPRSVAARDVA